MLKGKIEKKADKAILVSLAAGFLLVLYQIGFPKEKVIYDWINHFLRQLPRILMIFYFAKWLVNTILSPQIKLFREESRIELVMFILLFCFNFFKKYSLILSTDYALYILIITLFVIKVLEVSSEIRASLMTPPILFAISFLLLILWGTAMLLIPDATHGKFRFIDALFTAASTVCITGLATVDIPTKFTGFGINTLLILVQIGGLGLITFTNFFALLFRGGMSLRNQLMMSDIIETNEPGSLFSILKKILLYAVLVEVLGTLLIYFSIRGGLYENSYDNWYFAVFHSIASFIGSGFTYIPNGLYNDSLRFNYNFLYIISFLVIFGCIGFPVVNDLYNSIRYYIKKILRKLIFNEVIPYKPRLFSVHSKIVISTTFVILIIGTLSFYFLERNNAFADHQGFLNKMSISFFSASMRTAGFNAIDLGSVTQGTIMIYLFLMWVGGAPNSPAGGIKVTTFALGLLTVFSLAKGKERVEIFSREISLSSIRRSYVVIFLSLLILGISIFLVSVFDPWIPLQQVAFECFSAYCTVGMSLDITPMLSDGSKWVLIICMYLGKVGLFTILFGIFSKDKKSTSYNYPKENVQVL